MNHPGDTRADAERDATRTGWRGTARGTSTTATRTWQQGRTVQPLTQLRLREQGRNLRVAGLLLLLLILAAIWIYSLLFKAVQTPLVVVAGTDYRWPLPPNAWVREDLDRLGELHRRTLYMVEAAANWHAGGHALRDFEERLSETLAQRAGSPAVLIYVSMHGVVDGDGEPCLVPPDSSPLDASTWTPLRALLDSIRQTPGAESVDKILLLDCSRLQTEWRLGVLYNGFADRLPEVVRQAGVQNLVVVNSTGPGQVGWSSPELRGSAFAYFLRRALGGEADTDQDRQISLGELHDYLRVQVNRWAVRNRAASQEPLLIADPLARERTIAWAPSGGAPLRPLSGKPEVSQEALHQLWKDHDQILGRQAIRLDPLRFQDFQNRLLWLEQLNQSGRSYSKRANELREELLRWTGEFRQREAASTNLATAAGQRRLWDPDSEAAAGSLSLHSLPLAAFFGLIDDNAGTSLREQWRKSLQVDAPATLPNAAASPDGESVQPLLTEAIFLRQSRRQLAPADGDASVSQMQALSAVFAAVERGERVAVPEDERIADWLRGSIAQGDAARRAAEDALLAGDLPQAMENSRAADQAYARAEELARLVTAAFDLRDRALAELPYLAEWLAGEPLSDPPQVPDSEIAAPRLLRLIDNLHVLGQQLSAPEAAFVYVAPDTVPFAKSLRSVQGDFDWLRASFDDHVTALSKMTTSTPESLRKIQAVLATPLMAASPRRTLYDKWTALDRTLCRGEEVDGADDAPSAGEPQSAELATRLARFWRPHPAIQLLRPVELAGSSPAQSPDTSPAEPERGTDPPELGAGDSRPAAVPPAPPKPVNAASSEPADAVVALAAEGEMVRRNLRALAEMSGVEDRLARAAAAWWTPPAGFAPIAGRRRVDLQRLLLRHAERALRDFRGPVDGRGEPFFQLAGEDYLQGIALLGDTVPAVAQQRDELQNELQRSEFAVDLNAENVMLAGAGDAVQTRIRLRPDARNGAASPDSGRLALFVRSAGQRLAGVQFTVRQQPGTPDATGDAASHGGIAFPLRDDLVVQMQGEQLGLHGPRLDVVAAFRGHERTAPCLVQTIGGVTVDYQPATDVPTRVLVKGTRRQRKSFVFILDCSDSMKQPTGVEATDGPRILRLELAKNALQGMLDQLAEEPDTRVGVRFFGHRVGWSTTEPVRVLRRKDYAQPIPLELAPSDDVELILPLGRFDSLLAGQVDDRLDSVKPWGQTPLYRSLVEAIGDFERDDPDTEKHIIVITDGVNYQFSPSAGGRLAAPRPTSLDDVVAAWTKQKPFIHLVGFGIPEQEVEAAQREYRELIDRTSGTYETSAAEAQVLLRKLDQLLAKATYELLDESGNQVGVPIQRDGSLGREPGSARLGEPLVIRPQPDAAGQYTVVCQQLREPILLRGGEMAEFEWSADGRRLESAAYLAGAPRFAALTKGAGGSPLDEQFGVHRPVIESDGVRFEFSLQHPRQRFTARPAEVWIEVAPLDNEGQPLTAPYTFYDDVFAPGVPVPVIRWLAKGWPSGCSAARVGCWYKSTSTPPDVTVDAARATTAPAERTTFAEFPGVEFQLESLASAAGPQIRVVEWHGENSAGVGALKVDLAAPAGSGLQPARVMRTFDPDHRVAAHVFTLPADGSPGAGWEIRLTRADSVREDAIQLANPIDVPLAENTDQLPPLAPAEIRRSN